MSSLNESGILTGLSRRDAVIGMTATTGHVLQERGFDMVAALFGAPDAGGKLSDAALPLLMHGIILDFVARRLPGPGGGVLNQEVRFLPDPALGDRIQVSGILAARLPALAVAWPCDRDSLLGPLQALQEGADSAGIVPVAKVPNILTSRADSVASRLASIAVARLLAAGKAA